MNAVDVCNLALGYIGQGASRPIESITGTLTDEASRACQRVFMPVLEQLLRLWPWSFAQTSAALASPEGVAVPGWRYVYAYPNDCLFLHAVGDSDTDPNRPLSPSIPFKIVRNGESRVIATDVEQAWAHYTATMDDGPFDDPLFVEALAWRVAEKLALVLKATPEIARYAREQAARAVSEAAAAMLREAVQDDAPLAENIRVRGWGAR